VECVGGKSCSVQVGMVLWKILCVMEDLRKVG